MGAELVDEPLELGAASAGVRLAQRHRAVDERLHEAFSRPYIKLKEITK